MLTTSLMKYSYLVNRLSQCVLDNILVLRLKPDKSFQQLHFLLDDKVVDLGQVFKARGTVVRFQYGSTLGRPLPLIGRRIAL